MVDNDIVKYSIIIQEYQEGLPHTVLYDKHGTEFGYRAAHKSIKMTLRNLLRYRENITEDTIVTIEVRDGSGYFSSCPEVFPGYYNKSIKISEYLEL